MSNQPIAKGRIAAAVDKYPAKDNNGQDIMKNRYCTIGKLTIWPSDNGGQDYSIEIDAIPVGTVGPIKAVVFMDDEQTQQQNQAPQQGYQQPQQPQNNYQQQPPPPNYQGRR